MRAHKVLIFILAFRLASSKNGRGARWMPHRDPYENNWALMDVSYEIPEEIICPIDTSPYRNVDGTCLR